ncbi:hypothetical protein [Jannaschia formosa]|uniref:hypothetical protein n=1 Tax=Jannaschia formosa TaxID=2259592 RepID=UPI001075858C|nr:hypothetical protein [Jannaschia formosa]TFL16330.1 hypothetical protein DR046_20385 [Jannaschia formosa]
MTASDNNPPAPPSARRVYPQLVTREDGVLEIRKTTEGELEALLRMKTSDGASGVFRTDLEALGRPGQDDAQLVAAMYAEVEPRDGIEAMLVAHTTATHLAISTISRKMTAAPMYQVRESYERSMTRLSRTYIAQMEALKKYRAKAQQTVRVERVDVYEGGRAIVGDIHHGGRGGSESGACNSGPKALRGAGRRARRLGRTADLQTSK